MVHAFLLVIFSYMEIMLNIILPFATFIVMDWKMKTADRQHTDRRVLGEEWLDWREDCAGSENIDEGKKTFLILSMIVLAFILLLAALFLYLILPRFASFGRIWAVILTLSFAGAALFVIVWYALLFATVISRKSYTNLCLTRGSSLFFLLYPPVLKVGGFFGIARDRLSHSFIRVSNTLARPEHGNGPVLALFPRCLREDIRKTAGEICDRFPDVVLHTAPGGSVARKIICEINPRAIVAVACERDLISGIQDIAPLIPIIGIPNSRPSGPCKDTLMDIEKFRSAVEFFCISR